MTVHCTITLSVILFPSTDLSPNVLRPSDYPPHSQGHLLAKVFFVSSFELQARIYSHTNSFIEKNMPVICCLRTPNVSAMGFFIGRF